MWKHRCIFLILSLLGCSHIVIAQSLADLERQLDSLLRKKEKNEVMVTVGYGNNPAYGGKTTDVDRPIVMKNFLSPSVTYYHKSGVNASLSGYYLFDTDKNPWFEWDFSVGYDYTKNRKFLTGISYTRYFFADSTDIPATPIKNELFAYFYYRDLWLQPGISLDYGWGQQTDKITEFRRLGRNRRLGTDITTTTAARDFNVIFALRHPFMFMDVLKFDDALLLTPSLGFTAGTAHYYSNMKAFQYIARSSKIKQDIKKSKRNQNGQPLESEDATGFEPRALDCTINLSYIIGKFTFAPSYTIFKPLAGEDKSFMTYFTARVSLTL